MHLSSAGPETKKHRTLRVLFIEDSEADFVLLTRALERGGFKLVTTRVQSPQGLEEALRNAQWDLVLTDHAMPGFSAPAALQIVNEAGLDIPFIIVSGYIEEAVAVEAMRAGAHDYVMKDRLARLVPVVERELRESRIRQEQREFAAALKQAHEELESRVKERTADLQQANARLEQLLEERKRLEAELLEIAENERRRIGFDLHDDIGQKLAGASLMIKALERKLVAQNHPCAADARNSSELLAEIVERAHDLARQFSSMDAAGEDIVTVLKKLVANVKHVFAVPCGLTVRGTPPALPVNTVAQLHKIAQEAVSNAVKHGNAQHITLTLACDGDQTVLTIRNDGKRFSPPPGPTKRMGLKIMDYRAKTVGAVLTIAPGPRAGTVATCTLNTPGTTLPRRLQPSGMRPFDAVDAAPLPERVK